MGIGGFFIPAIMNVENNRNDETNTSEEIPAVAIAAD